MYLKYIIKHKWYVLVECWKLGILGRGLLHDLSKLLPSEWVSYVDYFYGNHPSRDEVLDYQTYAKFNFIFKEDVKRGFDIAWLHHQKRNKHHWQYWLLTKDSGETIALRMPEKYAKEMLADWRGAGRAINGYDDTKNWYLKNRDNMILHHETRAWVEFQLNVTE